MTNSFEKESYETFMKWYKEEIKKDSDYDSEFIIEMEKGIIGYSDDSDEGEYLEKAYINKIISKKQYQYLWKDFIGSEPIFK